MDGIEERVFCGAAVGGAGGERARASLAVNVPPLVWPFLARKTLSRRRASPLLLLPRPLSMPLSFLRKTSGWLYVPSVAACR